MARVSFRLVVALGMIAAAWALSAEANTISHPLPANQCINNSCSPAQLRIWNEFLSADGVAAPSPSRVYSGACYHRSSSMKSSDKHYGVAYFDTHEGGAHFNGLFGFYHSENPWANWTADDAAQNLSLKHTDLSLLHFEDSYAWTDFHPVDPPIWQYYFRQRGDTLYIVAFWSVNWTMFCEMTGNAAQP